MHKVIQVSCNHKNEPCQVQGLPVREIMEHWQDTGRWWAGEAEKSFYRILCQEGSIFEIYFEQQQWYLYKTYD